MKKNCLISHYAFHLYQHQRVYSAGPKVYFDKPCIGYVKKGYAKFLYKGQTFYAYEGDLIYIAQGTKYHSVWSGTPDIAWYSIDFSFQFPYDFQEFPFQIIKNYPCTLFDKMYETYEPSYMLSVSHFYRLLNDVYQKLKATSKTVSYIAIEPACTYIENNYTQSISISSLAALCHCSESGFFKLFKKSTGVTPIAYKHNMMISHALDLLSHTDLSIEEISAQVGFSSSNYFRKIFIKIIGKTPKELRHT